ncbi:hypothetical protein J2Z82_002586 [Virgibacillus litoralis]|uniref:Uncharacterized protein n=1 Tax=Virgibacillus litoralis TaxID=578221 RepID=A0ABS4HFE4_9BACI|nr:hypothetical protein [Virgibacillus litoralis]
MRFVLLFSVIFIDFSPYDNVYLFLTSRLTYLIATFLTYVHKFMCSVHFRYEKEC